MTEALQPYPAYKSSGTDWPDKTPEHWELQRLRATVASHTTGTWGLDPDGVNDLPCIRVADFDRGRLRVRADNPTLRSIKPTDRPKRTLQQGNLLLEKSGGGEKQPVGNIVLYDHQLVAVTSNFIERLTLQHDHNPAFFVYLHSALYAKGVNIRSIKQTTGIQNLDVSSYLSETIGVPDLSEQNAIVRYLDHANELINRYISAKERLIALLEEQRQAVIHQAVTRGLDPNAPSKQSSVEWLADVPQHWQLPEIKQVSKILRGKFTHRPRNDPSLYGGIYPFIQTGDVAAANGIIRTHRQTLNQRGLAVSTMFPAGTLVMTIAANIGDVAVLNFEACFPDSIVGFVPTNKVERDFLYYLFRAMKSEFLREAPVNTQGNLNVERIGSRKIPLPSVDEQVTIVRHLAEVSAHIDASMELTHRQVSLIGEYRTRLIADVVTGQIAVHDAVVELPGQHL